LRWTSAVSGAQSKKRLYERLIGAASSSAGRFPDELAYIREVQWLKAAGLVNSYADYLALPLSVLEDAQLVHAVDVHVANRNARGHR
jgi:hypothetical protein